MHRFILHLTVLVGLLAPGFSVSAQGPTLQVSAPAADAQISGSTVDVGFQVEGLTIVPSSIPLAEAGKHPEANRPGQGHLHLMLDLRPMVVWTETTPYRFTDVPSGPHLLTVELAQNDHASLTPPVIVQRRFNVVGGVTTSPPPAPSIMPDTGVGWETGRGQYVPVLVVALALLGGGGLMRRRVRTEHDKGPCVDDTALLETLIIGAPFAERERGPW